VRTVRLDPSCSLGDELVLLAVIFLLFTMILKKVREASCLDWSAQKNRTVRESGEAIEAILKLC
jgi:hypothetical protein